MKDYWNADRNDDADFIHTVRTNGEKINEYFFETGEVDAPFRETHYLYDGVKYRIYDYRFDNSAMELLDKSTKKSQPTVKSSDVMAKQRNKPVKKAPINKRIGRATLTNLETNEAREIDNNEFLEILNRNPSSRIKFRDVVMRYAPEGGTVGYRDTIDGVKYLVDVYGEPSEPLWASVRKSAKKSQPTAKSFNDMVKAQRNKNLKK